MSEVMNKKVIAIEYPRENEKVMSNCYTFRIAAMPGVKKVEVSINDSAWMPCRKAGDCWWYDWSNYGSGDYELVSRIQLSNGHFLTTEHRFFTVELEQS